MHGRQGADGYCCSRLVCMAKSYGPLAVQPREVPSGLQQLNQSWPPKKAMNHKQGGTGNEAEGPKMEATTRQRQDGHTETWDAQVMRWSPM